MIDTVDTLYDEEVKPKLIENIDNDGKLKKEWINTRATKDTRYAHFLCHKTATIDEKERWAVDILKVALSRATKPSVSCSFGIDSMVTLYLTRKALAELGRDPSDIDVTWNDTANEFPAVRKYSKQITEQWNLRLIVTKPEKTLKHVIADNGGITSDYFMSRKGDRRNGKPLSEKCCETLKHKPMRRMIKEHAYDTIINGLRADESSQRLRAGLRDGEFFYSRKEWKANVVRPILWMTEEDIWEYVEREQIPYNDLYLNNMIQSYPKNVRKVVTENLDKLYELGVDVDALFELQLLTVGRRQALLLKKMGFKLFTPRTGCMCCPIPIRGGYLQWMRTYYPKVYSAMIHNLGYGKALLDMVPADVREEIKALTGIDVTEENAHEHLQDILNMKPCTFDRF